MLPILNCLEHELNSNVGRLKEKELKVLLKWKGVPTLKMGNMAAKKVLYKKSGGEKDEESITDRRTDANEAALDTIKNAPIKGQYRGHVWEIQNREEEGHRAAYKKMTAEEKSDLVQKLAKLDTEDANDDECAPC